MEKEIYNLKLHDKLILKDDDNHITILRVPGGWLYTVRLVLKAKIKDTEESKGETIKQLFATTTFVPLSGEFNS
jgi:hypothetical protein